jgi:hypothetical protein
MGQEADGAALRKELETVYNAQVESLVKRDPGAFLESLYGAEERAEMIRSRFAEMAEGLLEMIPRLDQTTFVAVRTEGDDLAGYYFFVRDPQFVNIQLSKFVKVGGRWRIVPESTGYSFAPEEGEDVLARAAALVDSEPQLRLERPAPPPAASRAPAGSWDESLQAFLDCMAYDYEVAIAINGAPIDFKGGKSFSGRLFGAAAGGEPAQPAVLRAGENRIDVAYRFTGKEAGPSLTVTVRGPSGDPVCVISPPAGTSGKTTALFSISAG